jgi:hypothetical protein
MSARAMAASLALASLLACGGDRDRARPPAATADSAAAVAPVIDSSMLLISRGAAVAIGVDQAPGRVDSILAAEGMTADEYERLMYRIASDSLMSRLFQEALQGR